MTDPNRPFLRAVPELYQLQGMSSTMKISGSESDPEMKRRGLLGNERRKELELEKIELEKQRLQKEASQKAKQIPKSHRSELEGLSGVPQVVARTEGDFVGIIEKMHAANESLLETTRSNSARPQGVLPGNRTPQPTRAAPAPVAANRNAMAAANSSGKAPQVPPLKLQEQSNANDGATGEDTLMLEYNTPSAANPTNSTPAGGDPSEKVQWTMPAATTGDSHDQTKRLNLGSDAGTSDITNKSKRQRTKKEDIEVVPFDGAPELALTAAPDPEVFVYQGPQGAFKVSYEKTSEDQKRAFWQDFQGRANIWRKEINDEVFGISDLTEELDILDLRSASDLLPSLVNSDGLLRARAEKAIPEAADLQSRLQAKAKMFHKMALACTKQENSIKNALDNKTKLKVNDRNKICSTLDKIPASLSTIISTAEPTLSATEYLTLSRNLGDHVTLIAERYRREMTPMVEFIRKEGRVLAEKENRLLQLYQYTAQATAAGVEDPKRHFFPQFVQYLAPETHLCQCVSCETSRLQYEAAYEDLAEAGPPEPVPVFRYHHPFAKLVSAETFESCKGLTPNTIEDANRCFLRPAYTYDEWMQDLDRQQNITRSRTVASEIEYVNGVEEEQRKLREETEVSLAVLDKDLAFKRYEPSPQEILADEQRCRAAYQVIVEFCEAELNEWVTGFHWDKKERWVPLTLEERRQKLAIEAADTEESMVWQNMMEIAEDYLGEYFEDESVEDGVMVLVLRDCKDTGMPRRKLPRDREGKQGQMATQLARTYGLPPKVDAYKKRLREMPREQRPTKADLTDMGNYFSVTGAAITNPLRGHSQPGTYPQPPPQQQRPFQQPSYQRPQSRYQPPAYQQPQSSSQSTVSQSPYGRIDDYQPYPTYAQSSRAPTSYAQPTQYDPRFATPAPVRPHTAFPPSQQWPLQQQSSPRINPSNTSNDPWGGPRQQGSPIYDNYGRQITPAPPGFSSYQH